MDGDVPLADVARDGGQDGLLDVLSRSCRRDELADEVDVLLLGLGEAAGLHKCLVGVPIDFPDGEGIPAARPVSLCGAGALASDRILTLPSSVPSRSRRAPDAGLETACRRLGKAGAGGPCLGLRTHLGRPGPRRERPA